MKYKLGIISIIVLSIFVSAVCSQTVEAQVFSGKFLQKIKSKKSGNSTKVKKVKIEEIYLPPVSEGRPKIPFAQMPVLTIDECVQYAIEHSPDIQTAKEQINVSKSGIGIARSNYAPRLTAKVGYNHTSSNGSRVANSSTNSIAFNAGVSAMIWDFGRTTAKINMAKYDTKSAQYDYDYDVLDLIFTVRINYYKVLSALANLDIFEQNVRIQTLNYERTKAMFDEGLKSKIDVVNAEVNLADAKIQLVEGQNSLLSAIIELKNSMFYQEDKPFIVKNTENFGFLKSDYRKKYETVDNASSPKTSIKRTEDGLIMLSSGIEHRDIIQGFVLHPLKLDKQKAVDNAFECRPDLKSIKMVINVQEESLKAIKRQYAPEITGDLNWNYTKYESSYSSPLTVGANVGIGSINPYGIHYQIKQGEGYLNIAKHNYNIAKSGVYWEVQNNYINMRLQERKIPLMSTKVKATLENFELADGRYSVGLNNYVELQDALTNYNKAQLNFVETVFKYNTAREALLKSMGVNILEDKWQNDI